MHTAAHAMLIECVLHQYKTIEGCRLKFVCCLYFSLIYSLYSELELYLFWLLFLITAKMIFLQWLCRADFELSV